MATWNIKCETCAQPQFDIECSMFALPPCTACGGMSVLAPSSVRPKTAIFPFTSPHIAPGGKSITIDSMEHLRKVEHEYGVVLSAFSKANIHDTDPIQDLPRYRGEDPDFRRNHKGRY